MASFSERYGYTKPSDVIIREKITPEIQNAILNCYDKLRASLEVPQVDEPEYIYYNMERYLWTYFLNQRESLFRTNIISDYINDPINLWYKKLDMIECSIEYLIKNTTYAEDFFFVLEVVEVFTLKLNEEFKRLNFAYRIINNKIIEITAQEEIVAIEKALENNSNNIKTHLSKALELYAQKPTGDYRNSIKESISAVEAISRNITGENTLNFKKMEEKGVILPSVLRQAFEKLYGYTNDKSTGIRHALMDDTNAPQAEEALFILVSCSAFINYLNKKVK
nr:MAG TPA: AbiJ-like protein [Caudoviricetes sp.]